MSLLLGRTSFGDIANKGNTLSRDEAATLFNDWVLNTRLQLHMKQVAYLMKCWAAENERLGDAYAELVQPQGRGEATRHWQDFQDSFKSGIDGRAKCA